MKEQSEGEWTDEMVEKDARHFADSLRPLFAPKPISAEMVEQCVDAAGGEYGIIPIPGLSGVAEHRARMAVAARAVIRALGLKIEGE